ncbi:hypothetical protein [Enterobacter cloacae complex sp. 357B1]|uniref:hypothetical protein n=1 Tax=Enterobacter cloacae complex sp. 357B1 TaxID=3395827 RepID=UPI003CF24FE1
MLNNTLISEFMLTDNIPQYQNQTWTGETITRVVGSQYFTLSFKVTLNKMNRAELANFYALYGQGKETVLYASWMVEYIQRYSNITSTGNSSKGSGGNIHCR